MPKPLDLAVWATDDLFPAGLEIWSETDTKVEPTSGKQAEGWEPGERPAAQYMNWFMNNVCQWLAYLDENVIDGDLEIDGSLDVNVDLNIDGDIINRPNFLTGWTSTTAPAAPDYYFTTALVVAVPAIMHFQPDYLSGGSATHLLVSNGSRWQVAASANVLICPIALPIGDVLTFFEINLEKNTTTVSNAPWQAQIFKVAFDGTVTAIGSPVTNDEDQPGWTTLSDAPALEIETGFSYHIRITPPGTLNGGNDFLNYTALSYTRPAP